MNNWCTAARVHCPLPKSHTSVARSVSVQQGAHLPDGSPLGADGPLAAMKLWNRCAVSRVAAEGGLMLACVPARRMSAAVRDVNRPYGQRRDLYSL